MYNKHICFKAGMCLNSDRDATVQYASQFYKCDVYLRHPSPGDLWIQTQGFVNINAIPTRISANISDSGPASSSIRDANVVLLAYQSCRRAGHSAANFRHGMLEACT